MPYLARFSPKLRSLSRAPSALALTRIPDADICCARSMNSASPLGSGANRNEFTILRATTDTHNRSVTIRTLCSREIFLLIAMINNANLEACGFSQNRLVPRYRGGSAGMATWPAGPCDESKSPSIADFRPLALLCQMAESAVRGVDIFVNQQGQVVRALSIAEFA